MAVLDSLPGIESSIWAGTEKLEEYEDDEEETLPPGYVGEYRASRTASKFVESKSDIEYSVRIVVDRSYYFDSDCLLFKVSIDGKVMARPIMQEPHYPRVCNRLTNPGTINCVGAKTLIPGQTGRSFLRKFKFAKIETSTDEYKFKDVEQDSKRIADAGEIKIEVFRGGAAKPPKPSTYHPHLPEKAENVHEKALKGQAKSHTTLLGPSSETTSGGQVTVTPLDGYDFPIVIFKFKYRSKESLKSLLIIKRSPSPESDPELLSAGPFSIGRKIKRESALQDMTGDDAGFSDTLNRPIKRERDNNSGESLRKKRKSDGIMMIDLTASDED